MKLSVIIPVYNEADTIATVLARVKDAMPDAEIIVVDDGSTDETTEILREMRKEKPPRPRIILCSGNGGKGQAIRIGLIWCHGDYVIIQDADLEYDPWEADSLWWYARITNADVVYGTRMHGNKWLWKSYLANRVLAMLTNLLYGSRLTDIETCYKLIRTDLLRGLNLRNNRFNIETEITAKLLRRGVGIVELPISYNARTKGKKAGWRDGVQAVWDLFKWKFVK